MLKKSLKKSLSLFLAMLMVLTCVPMMDIPIANATVIASGYCGSDATYQNVRWSLEEETGILTISGIGSMHAYNGMDIIPWDDYRKNILSVNIEEGVTSISKYAFSSCPNLTSVTLPDGLTNIGWYAFASCSNLESITMPDSVTGIGQYAFENCTSLKSINISKSLTTINMYTFNGCSSLESVIIPDSVTELREYAFRECTNLKNVILSNNLTKIPSQVFYNCTSLESIIIPDSVTKIGEDAFHNCQNLKTVILSNNLTSISSEAFRSCYKLETIIIPESVTSIGYNTFRDCTKLKNIYFLNKNTQLYNNAGTISTVTKIHGYCYEDTNITPYTYAQTYNRNFVSLGHDFTEWAITKEATATEYGEETRTCSICGYAETKYFGDTIILAEDIVIHNTTFVVGDTKQLETSIIPANTTNTILSYTSSDENIVFVTSDGKVLGVNPGEATITVATIDGSGVIKETAVTVINKIPVTEIILDKTEVSLFTNETYQIEVTISPNNATNTEMTYKSNNTNVATVDNSGNVTAIAPGSATITIAAESGITTTITVTVNPKPIESIVLNANSVTLLPTERYQIEAAVLPETAITEDLTYSVKGDVVRVGNKGLVIADKPGEATIIVASKDNPDIYVEFKVIVEHPIYKITLLKGTGSGGPDYIYVKNNEFYSDENAENKITKIDIPTSNLTSNVFMGYYNSSNVKIVDINGNLTNANYITADTTLTAKWQSGSIWLNTTSLNVSVGATNKINYSTSPSSGVATFVSMDETIATVDANGNVTGATPGTTKIKVMPYGSEAKAQYVDVTVVTPVTEIICDITELTLPEGSKYNINAYFTPEEAADYKALRYSKVKESIKESISINQDGTITAREPGTTTIELYISNKENWHQDSLNEEEKALKHTIQVTVVPIIDYVELGNKDAEGLETFYFGYVEELSALVAYNIETGDYLDVSENPFKENTNYLAITNDLGKAAFELSSDTIAPETIGGHKISYPYLVYEVYGMPFYIVHSGNRLLLIVPPVFELDEQIVGIYEYFPENIEEKIGDIYFVANTEIMPDAFISHSIDFMTEDVALMPFTENPFEEGYKYLVTDDKGKTSYGICENDEAIKQACGFNYPYLKCDYGNMTLYVGYKIGSDGNYYLACAYPGVPDGMEAGIFTISKLTENKLSIATGETIVFDTLIFPEDAGFNNITVSTTDENVVKVNKVVNEDDSVSVELVGVNKGNATVTMIIEDNGGNIIEKTYKCETYQTHIPVTEVTIKTENTTLNVDEELKLDISVNEDATNKELEFVVNEPGVVEVDNNGNIKAVGEGTVTVTVTSKDDPTKFATVTIIVKIPVTKITAAEDFTINLSDSKNVGASVNTDATNKELIYSSDNEAIATVDKDGNVTAVGVGTATITITTPDNDKVSETVVVTVKKFAEEITTDKNTYEVNLGDTVKINAAVKPDDATDKTLEYKSENTNIATVGSDGTITPVGRGTTTITIAGPDGTETTVTVTVKQPVTNINIPNGNDNITLNVGEEKEIGATTNENADYGLIYESSNSDVVEVTDDGKLVAKADGEATITIKSEDGKITETIKVTVKQPATSVTVDKAKLELNINDTDKITGSVDENASDKTVKYESSDKTIVTVDNEGNVTAVGKGTAIITVTAADGSGVSAIVEVEVKQPVTEITIPVNNITINVNANINIGATAKPSNANVTALKYTSSNPAVATVDEIGKVTAISKGTAIITITAASGVTATVNVEVKQPVTNIEISDTNIELDVSENKKITATAYPANANDTTLTYTSSDSSVVTIDKDGNIKAVGAGDAIITITAASGVKKEVTVTVKAILVDSITANSGTTKLFVGESTTIVTTITPANATNKNITFTSTDTSVVTVASNGTVTAVGAGTATIIITSADKHATTIIEFTTEIKPEIKVEAPTDVKIGDTGEILVIPNVEGSYVTEYEVSDESVVKVDENGNLTAVGKGTATVTAKVTLEDGTVITKEIVIKSVDPDEGKFFCSFCPQYEAMKDSPVGFIYTIVHFFIHMIQSINFAT